MANQREDHRESVSHMLSEFCCELSALILVFVPLDYLLKGDKLGPGFGTRRSRFWLSLASCLAAE
jgi:hypothetical protein